MSSVRAYFLFWMMFIHKQECSVIRYHHNRNAFEYVIQKYMNPLRRLSADLPNHAIELEIEIQEKIPREVTYDPRRFIRLINPRLSNKPIPRAQDAAGDGETSNAPEAAANITVPLDPGQVAAAPAAIPAAPAPAAIPAMPAPAAETDPETQKIPVFMEDLKKALDELEKKLITTPENLAAVAPSGNAPSIAGAPQAVNTPAAVPQVLNQQVRSIDDIVQLLKKGIHIERRMPKAGDEKLEWVQIKIPKSIQL